MKKIPLLFILIFAGLTVGQAQNKYLQLNPTASTGRLVIPDNDIYDVGNATVGVNKTITFKLMIPTAGDAIASGRIMIKNSSTTTANNGSYGISYGTVANTARIVEYSNDATPVYYGNFNNTPSTFTDGNWHHIALVLNDDADANKKSKLYVDGVLFVTASNSTNAKTGNTDMSNASDLIFGAGSTGGNVVKMNIDDIRIWDHTLTNAEITTDRTAVINDATTANATSGLLAAYSFETGSVGSAKIIDLKGGDNATVLVSTSGSNIATGPSLATKSLTANTLTVIIEPNPTTDILNINAPEATEGIAVQVIDLSGKTVAATKSQGTSATVSLSNKPAGIYLVKVTDGTSSYTQKIIKN